MALMMLVSVLAVLGAIAIPAYQDYRERAGSGHALEPEAALYLQLPERHSPEPLHLPT